MAPRDEILSAEDIRARFADRVGWTGDTQEITKTFDVEYHAAVDIIVEVAQAAIELEHHPDVDLRWDKLRFMITTHTAGDKVTELDFLLADRIDTIATHHGAAPTTAARPG
jgi:4a-hydroxytetrahydrobiopterin dehydratase